MFNQAWNFSTHIDTFLTPVQAFEKENNWWKCKLYYAVALLLLCVKKYSALIPHGIK